MEFFENSVFPAPIVNHHIAHRMSASEWTLNTAEAPRFSGRRDSIRCT